MLHRSILQKKSLHKTLNCINSYAALDSKNVTRIIAMRFRQQQRHLHTQWKAQHDKKKKQRLNINHEFRFGNLLCTLLHLAAANGSDRLLQALLKAEADVNVIDTDGNTLLHCAVKSSSIKTLNILLATGVKESINATNRCEETALHLAAMSGNIAVVNALLAAGAKENINAQDAIGYTALHWSVMSDNYDVANTLLSEGASIDVQDKNRQTALHLAVFGDPITQKQRTLETATVVVRKLHKEVMNLKMETKNLTPLSIEEVVEAIRISPHILPIESPVIAELFIVHAVFREVQPDLIAIHPVLFRLWNKHAKEMQEMFGIGRESYTVNDGVTIGSLSDIATVTKAAAKMTFMK